MPNFKSDTVTAQELAASRSGNFISDAALTSGSLHFIQAKLTVPAGTAIADTFELVTIPNGLTIVPGLSSIVGAGAGASTTLALGFTGATSAVATATAVSTAGVKHLAGSVGNVVNTSDRKLIATLAGGAMTAAVVLFFNIVCVKGE
jgi:hypothetical protein